MRYGYRRRLYRSRDGIIWGVCQGLADYFEVPVGILRTIAVVSFILTGFFPVGVIYALAALILPLEPIYGTSSRSYREHSWDHRYHR